MKHLAIIPVLAILISCQGTTKTTDAKASSETKAEAPLVGGEKDEHGCLTSAGYTWSEIRKDCIRLFEAGIRLNPTNDSESHETSGFLVFSNDSSKVELYLPSLKGSDILTKENNVYQSSDKQYKLDRSKSIWTLMKDNKVIYSSK